MAYIDGGDQSVPTAMFYRFWVQTIQRGWNYIYKEALEIDGNTTYDLHKNCLIKLRPKLEIPADFARWKSYFDMDPTVTAEQVIETVTVYVPVPISVPVNGQAASIKSAEDITPRMFKESCYAIAAEVGKSGRSVDVDLPTFLRRCLTHMFNELDIPGRINVGANRHFPRLYQWLCEVEYETSWIEGPGLRIKNAGGAGPVAAEPTDPRTLKVTIKKDRL